MFIILYLGLDLTRKMTLRTMATDVPAGIRDQATSIEGIWRAYDAADASSQQLRKQIDDIQARIHASDEARLAEFAAQKAIRERKEAEQQAEQRRAQKHTQRSRKGKKAEKASHAKPLAMGKPKGGKSVGKVRSLKTVKRVAGKPATRATSSRGPRPLVGKTGKK